MFNLTSPSRLTRVSIWRVPSYSEDRNMQVCPNRNHCRLLMGRQNRRTLGNGRHVSYCFGVTRVGIGHYLFWPAVAVGQEVRTPKVRIHTGVSLQTLLNSGSQALENSEQDVVSCCLVLSDEQSKTNPLFEAVGMSGGESFRRVFLFRTILPLAAPGFKYWQLRTVYKYR